MPLPGAQHASIANPFEEPQRRMSEYTAQEVATLQSRLEKQLGPEYISSRSGPSGQKVHYVTAEKCIALANDVFGFNGWSSGIQNIQVDFVEENPQTLKVSLGLSVIVRVTLRDGTYHEDIGYGHIENCKGKAAAFEKAKKEGTTDALKRALRNFGNVLGNCIYDKAYLAKVTKIKVEPTKFDEANLHRHADFAVKPKATEVARVAAVQPAAASKPGTALVQNDSTLLSSDSFEEFMSELDEADFCVVDEGHPDEVVLNNSNQNNPNQNNSNETSHNGAQQTKPAAPVQPPPRPVLRSASTGSNVIRQPQTPNQASTRPNQFGGPQNQNQNQHQQGGAGVRPNLQGSNNQTGPSAAQQNHGNAQNGTARSNLPSGAAPNAGQNNATGPVEGAGFFSARVVNQLPEDLLSSQQFVPKANQAFNPRAESPSIRKTPGIDHSKSKPVGRNGQHVAGPPAGAKDASNITSSQSGAVGSAAAGGQGSAASPGVVNRPGQFGSGPGAGGPRNHLAHPQLDGSRRIGAPMGVGSPLANRNQYRPPTIKRPAQEAAGQTPGRPPLADVSTNNPPGANVGSGPDAKRQRTS